MRYPPARQLLAVTVCLAVSAGLLGAPLSPRAAGVVSAPHKADAVMSPPAALKADVARAYAALPLAFEPNRGQAHAGIDFVARGGGYAVSLGAAGMAIRLSPHPRPLRESSLWGLATGARQAGEGPVLRFTLTGADRRARAVRLDRLPGVVNYILGRDPRRWRTGVPTYARVAYRDIYPGVDLVYYGTGQRLEYDFVLAPGADPRRLALAVGGARGLRIDRAGDLTLRTGAGELRQGKPGVYQEIGGVRQTVPARYVLHGHDVSVAVGAYDRARPLVIDPALSYATYLGGNSADDGAGIAVDASGSAYVVGTTNSTNFPTTAGAAQTSNSAVDNVFVTKMNPAGNGLVYSTYLGGNGGDVGAGIAVDSAGRAYVTGHTNSTDFPTKNAYQGAKSAGAGANSAGNNDAFVARLNAAGGALDYGSLLGGSLDDEAQGIAVDGAGVAYVTGFTYSSDFPTTSGASQTVYNNGGDSFVAKVNTNASGTASLAYSTYLGGGAADFANAIAIDAAGAAYVTGSTASADFPTMGAAQGTLTSTSSSNAFVSKLNVAGSALVYSTYLGGSGSDAGGGIAVDGTGAAYVTGSTSSPNFPATAGAYQRSFAGGPGDGDAFAAKLNGAGAALVYATYLGGSDEDEGLGVALDAAGDAYITGRTASATFPTQSPVQGTFGGGTCGDSPCADAFVTALNPAGSGLLYSTYLGGGGDDEGAGIALDPGGAVYVTGAVSSSFPFATTNSAPSKSNTDSGTTSAFVVKLASQTLPTPPTPTQPAGDGQPSATTAPTGAPGAPSPTAGPGGQPSATPPALPTATAAPGAPSSTPRAGTTPGATATPAPPTVTPANSATAAAQATGAAAATATGTPANSATAGAVATGAVVATATGAAAETRTVAAGGPPAPTNTSGAGRPTATPGPVGGHGRASIALSPPSVRVGGRVVVRGGGFVPGERITLSLNGEALSTAVVVVGRDGHFTAAFVAPDSLLQGANTVGAIGAAGDMAAATLAGLVPVASRYYFAGGVNALSEQSSLDVLNPTGGRATLRLTFYFAHGVTRGRSLSVGPRAELVAPMRGLRLPAGDFGLSLTADRRVAAALDIARPGRDGDSIPGATGLGQTWYLAEGYTGLTFRESVAILNPGAGAARVRLQLLPFGGRPGGAVTVLVTAHSHTVVDVNRLLPRQSLSIVARSNQPVVVARTLRFGRDGAARRGGARDYGETVRAGGNVAAGVWLLAEGTTANHFQTFLTILNPGDRRAGVTALFFGSDGRRLGRRALVMAPRSRANIKFGDLGRVSGIASMVTSSQPVIVERPEYFGSPNGPRVAGSDVFGRNGAAPRWSFPGAAGAAPLRSEFYLLYNPSATAARVRATLYDARGRTATATVSVGPRVRYTLDAGRLFRGFPGAHGATLESLNGVGFVAEQTLFAPDRSTLQSTQGLAQ